MNINFREFSNEELSNIISTATAELEQRQRSVIPDNAVVIAIEDGCIDQRELHYEKHSRGKNWIATVASDKTQPGGLARNFWSKASGSYKQLPDDLNPGDRIEVADDYTSSSGKSNRSRHFYVVHSVTTETLTLVEED